jgi:hypothetical protein
MIIYLHIIDCNQNFVYSNNINTMNALILPDLIQSMIFWYIWKNKISILNKQYHEVFKCNENDENPSEITLSNKKGAYLCMFNYRYLNDTEGIQFYPYASYRILTIFTWKFDVKENKYIYRHGKETKNTRHWKETVNTIKLPSNYLYSNPIYEEIRLTRKYKFLTEITV